MRALIDLLGAVDPAWPPVRVACAAADDENLLLSLRDTIARGLVRPILIGPVARMSAMVREAGLMADTFEVIDVVDKESACARAVHLCQQGQAAAIMKGAVPTSILLKAVLRAENRGPVRQTLTHVTVFRPRGFRRLMVLADAGVQIAPDAGDLTEIVIHAARVARCLRIRRPKVAMLSAAEFINPKMPSSVIAADVAALCAARPDIEADVGGPYALDVAVSPMAASQKGIVDGIAGRADVLITPGIDAGNVLYKSLTCFSDLDLASVVVGAAMPMIISSRADSERTKIYSTALALLLAQYEEIDRSRP